MLEVALIPPSQFGHGASDGVEKVFRPTILIQNGHVRHWSYMSDNNNVSVRQPHIEMKIELAFAAGMSMSFDRSVQHDFILTEVAFASQPRVTQPGNILSKTTNAGRIVFYHQRFATQSPL